MNEHIFTEKVSIVRVGETAEKWENFQRQVDEIEELQVESQEANSQEFTRTDAKLDEFQSNIKIIRTEYEKVHSENRKLQEETREQLKACLQKTEGNFTDIGAIAEDMRIGKADKKRIDEEMFSLKEGFDKFKIQSHRDVDLIGTDFDQLRQRVTTLEKRIEAEVSKREKSETELEKIQKDYLTLQRSVETLSSEAERCSKADAERLAEFANKLRSDNDHALKSHAEACERSFQTRIDDFHSEMNDFIMAKLEGLHSEFTEHEACVISTVTGVNARMDEVQDTVAVQSATQQFIDELLSQN
ncbi:hypothetical protein ST47_g7450 [Ascochyta rabiei]|uniref:Uncharacterized protein n=2 Tax=Didymella rabiei TaxID=5454 RepID=A0A163B0F9_DIDRA|nr:hypothetical protein ST47_g7450 [Ascochyta rabiei]